MTDPLTGLRNHRAFQEDLARELQRVGRTGEPLALALLDVDELKARQRHEGHQAGDERLQALADAIRATQRAADCGYRIGGDEFAVILPGPARWARGVRAARLRARPARRASAPAFTATAGIAEALGLRSRDDLVREADLALIGAKRVRQDVAIYGPDLESPAEPAAAREDEHHTPDARQRARPRRRRQGLLHPQPLPDRVAAVRARSPPSSASPASASAACGSPACCTTSARSACPDAILNKPARADRRRVRRSCSATSLLGCDIVRAADLPDEARWVRHHHERFDGGGYPRRPAGDGIPLESRIILVADAFEAMTSDRPYRRAPGQEFAIAELRRHAGTQFDPAVVDALCRVLDRGGVGAAGPAPPVATRDRRIGSHHVCRSNAL